MCNMYLICAVCQYAHCIRIHVRDNFFRDSKMKGGMVGMTLNKGAVHRWLMGQAERSAITKQREIMANVTEVTR